MSVKMKSILVTGATRGVGEALTLKFAQKGYVVYALARTRNQLNSLVEKCGADKVIPFEVDVSNKEQVEEATAAIQRKYGTPDVLINNAGVVENVSFAEQELEMIDRIVDVNLKGTLYVTRCIVPGMIARGSGRIINVSSVARDSRHSGASRLLRIEIRHERICRHLGSGTSGQRDIGHDDLPRRNRYSSMGFRKKPLSRR